jgi:hypothetical protein
LAEKNVTTQVVDNALPSKRVDASKETTPQLLLMLFLVAVVTVIVF